MQVTPDVLTIEPALHPNPRVREVGFDLDHPYVEQCWAASIGPTSVLLLRRVVLLWQEATPARVQVDEIAASLGVGGDSKPNSRFWRTVRRLTQFGLARPGGDGTLDVFTTVAPLSARQLARAPDWSVRTHQRWINDQLDRLGEPLASGRSPAAAMAARLDRLERSPAPDLRTLGR
jgi:hypothetical protein